ncbi:MAG: hypothetical protein MRQ13_05240 [Candidatus Midichloria sp.]|nr:hypothetical protein [Candidatus Midichloria sp.]
MEVLKNVPVTLHHIKACGVMEGLAGMKNYMKAWPTGSEILAALLA